MSRNVSLLGCFNDRDQKMRKMAKATALRLAEKQKETNTSVSFANSALNSSGKYGVGVNIRSSTKPRSTNIVGGSGSNNSISGDMVKLPKMGNGSIKNIDPVKKNENGFRITNNSRNRGRV